MVMLNWGMVMGWWGTVMGWWGMVMMILVRWRFGGTVVRLWGRIRVVRIRFRMIVTVWGMSRMIWGWGSTVVRFRGWSMRGGVEVQVRSHC